MKKVVLILFVLVAAGLLWINFSLNSIVKKGIETVGPQVTGTRVIVDNIDISLLGGTVTLKGLEIGSPEGFKAERVFSLGRVTMKMDTASLKTDTILIKEISIEKPEITYEMTLAGTNVGALQRSIRQNTASTSSGPSEGTASTKRVIIKDVYINGAKVTAMIAEQVKETTLEDIHLQNIGQEGQGVSLALAGQKVLEPVVVALLQSDLTSQMAADLGGFRGAAEGAKALVKGVGDSLKGLFGGK